MSKSNVVILSILSICLFLATTIGIIMFNLSFKYETIYMGEITIESQEEYVAFVQALSRGDIKINGLYYPLDTPYGLQIMYLPEGKHYAYSLPARIGFDVQSSMGNPTANLTNIVYYTQIMSTVNNNLIQIILSLCIAAIGYSLAIGAWMGRNGIYEKPKRKTTK